jgi:hypothetical protein
MPPKVQLVLDSGVFYMMEGCITCKIQQAYCHEDSETDVPDGNEINVMGVPFSIQQKRLSSVYFRINVMLMGLLWFTLIKAALEQAFANTVLRTVLPSA